MRLILQRVRRAAVEVDGERIAAIGRGLLVLVGVEPGDGAAQVAAAVEKLTTLRVFDDGEGRMNLDLAAAGGSLLVVSQFTLLADLTRGRRPSFTGAAPPDVARPLVDDLVARLRSRGCDVERGRFGAAMRVELVNDGPVTLTLDLAPGGSRRGTVNFDDGDRRRHEAEDEDGERRPG
jgi:D-tyrosyl-tRNA(Tyr) deacylase